MLSWAGSAYTGGTGIFAFLKKLSSTLKGEPVALNGRQKHYATNHCCSSKKFAYS